MSTQAPRFAVWYRDDAACSQALRSGAPVEAELSSFGEGDLVLDFLVSSGLWSVLTSMEPDKLRMHNGKPWSALNGVEVLRELARVDRIAHCGKILRDTRLMMIAGFNAEAVTRARARDRPVVDPETLANHLDRISPRSAARAFTRHVELLRRKRWIRGNTYVADAHEITLPYGRHSERMGRIGEKFGYKLVVLLNATPDRERIVGFVLAPLQHGERALLQIILRDLDRRFGPLRRWMHTLLLDRGYWGAEFLLGLHRRYGMDLVTLARDEDLEFTRELDRLAATPDAPWRWTRETHSHFGEIQVHLAGFDGIELYDKDGQVLGQLNAAVADEYDAAGARLRDEKGDVRPRFHYATTLPAAGRPERIRRYYDQRWVIENQGFRELTQAWSLDCPAGRRFNVLNARIAFALMLYNGDRLLRMKHPDLWQEIVRRQQAFGERNRLGGPTVAAYTPEGHLGLYTIAEYGQLVADRERGRLLDALREGLAQGESLERVVERLKPGAPRKA
jgi:hypothetical protein